MKHLSYATQFAILLVPILTCHPKKKHLGITLSLLRTED